MKNIIVGLVFILIPFISFAHNPLSARYHLDAGAEASLLTINLSQDGVNVAFIRQYGEQRLEKMTRNELEELIVDYIKSNFDLSVDGKEIELKMGGIKLGSHQTDLKFVLPALSNKIERMDIHIPAFKENENHQAIFTYNINGSSEHTILSAKNNYQSTVMITSIEAESNWFWFALTTLVGLFSSYLLIKKFT